MADALAQAQARNKELQAEVSELGRQHELRGRELAASRKQSDRVEGLEAEIERLNGQCSDLVKALNQAQRDAAELREQLARTHGVLEDVEALKRLVA